MFSVPDMAQHTQEADCPCDVCLAWSLTSEEGEALFAAVAGVASPLDAWVPLSDQEQREARLLTSLGILFPTTGDAESSYQLTALGLRVAVVRLLIAEALLDAATASALQLVRSGASERSGQSSSQGKAAPDVH
jgi:hypothetical protein